MIATVLTVKRVSRLLFAIAAVILLAAEPSRAGALAYPDAAGDATAVDDADVPRPSDPELDLLEVSWSTTADELVITTTLSALGDPAASNGWAVAHYFDYEGIRFELLAQDIGTPTDAAFADGVYLRIAEDSTTEYPCVCRFTTKAEQARVTITAELHSIGSAAKAIDPRLPRPAPESEFTDLQATSFRVVGFLLAADRAQPPAGTTFVV